MSPKHPKAWLALIVALYLLLAAVYAVQVPAWQAPDEPAHYNYIHELATTGQFPVLRMGDYDQAALDQLKAAGFPSDLSIAGVRYEAHQPPLYYLLAGPVFRATGGRLIALRLFSALLGALLVVLVYAIAATIFPGRLHLALGAAAFTAFLPMHLAMTASVNNDALAEVLLAAILLLSLRYVKTVVVDSTTPGAVSVLLIGLLLGLALITKVSAYVAVPIVFAALLIGWYESRRIQPRPVHASRFAFHALLVAVPALLIALPWYARNASVYGHMDFLARRWHDTVVVGQLRTADLLGQAGLGATLERFIVWSHDSFWGVFGWMGVWMDSRVYTLLLAFSIATLTGCIVLLLRKARTRPEFPSPHSPAPTLQLPVLTIPPLGPRPAGAVSAVDSRHLHVLQSDLRPATGTLPVPCPACHRAGDRAGLAGGAATGYGSLDWYRADRIGRAGRADRLAATGRQHVERHAAGRGGRGAACLVAGRAANCAHLATTTDRGRVCPAICVAGVAGRGRAGVVHPATARVTAH